MSRKIATLGEWLRWLKWIVAIGFVIVLVMLADQALIWAERFSRLPTVLQYLLASALGALALIGSVLWLRHRQRKTAAPNANPPPSAQSLAAAIENLSERGAQVAPAREELAALQLRREQPAHYIAFFGAISMGKSSLIKALSGDVDIAVDVRGGTTRAVRHYRARIPGVGEVLLADAPGFGDAFAPELASVAQEEAIRADLVVYVADGDLTQTQLQQLRTLSAYDKPMILALNKSDQLDATDRAQLLQRLAERVPDADLVLTSAGHREWVIRIEPSGVETRIERDRPTELEALKTAIVAQLTGNVEAVRAARDASMLRLGAQKLRTAQLDWSATAANSLIQKYTQRAMLGAMAAVAPGTDLVIQGVLGARFLSELCGIYEIDAREVEIGDLLRRIELRARLQWAVGLSIAGNGLKAFPGLGTLGGGLVHAVAYGLVFETVGRAVADSLKARGALETADIVSRISLNSNAELGARAVALAKLAIAAKRSANHE